MSDYDIIIKGGTIVDGTRTPRYVSDIAVKDGKIVRIGGLSRADSLNRASPQIAVQQRVHFAGNIKGHNLG